MKEKKKCIICGKTCKEEKMKKEIRRLQTTFKKLRNRIIKHRSKCKYWNELKPCYNCHVNTLTDIEEAIQYLI